MFSPEMKEEHLRRQAAFDGMTPEERFAAGITKHKPTKKQKRAAKPSAKLEGDLPTRTRGKIKLPQTPERIRKNKYMREYNRKRQRARG
jgi:hypothetical protein